MNTATGGVATAAGLRFQYLATMDVLLDWLEGPRDFVITTEDPVDEVVDFSVVADGSPVLLAQAKTSVDGDSSSHLSPGEVIDQGIRLCRTPSEKYLLCTNRELSPGARALIRVLSTASSEVPAAELRRRLREPLTKPTYEKLATVDEDQLLRLTRLTVSSTMQSLDDYAGDIARRVLALRRREARGGGRASADVLLHYCVAAVLRRSAQRAGRGMTRDEARAMLGLSARTLAHTIGEYDWGVTTGPFPKIRTAVSRPDLIDQMLAQLGYVSEGRALRTMVLTGPSGAGKSSLAAALCDLIAVRYDSLHWIDASSDTTLRSQFTALVEDDLSALTDQEAAHAVRSALERDPAARLIVLDNTPDQSSVMEWLPAHGHVDVLATSTNFNGWDHWGSIRVGAMTELEALSLVQSRLQVDQLCSEDEARARKLVRRLDAWPLAIELACTHLQRSGRGLALTEEYLERLTSHVIDNETLIPEDYRSHPTLLQAIKVALDTLEVKDHASRGLRGTTLLHTLAYLPARGGLLDVAVPVAVAAQRSEYPDSIAAPESRADLAICTDEAVARLGEASLVERYWAADEFPDRVRTNAVVLDVVKQLDGGHAQEQRVRYLHALVDTVVREALEQEGFARVGVLVPSAMSAIDQALSVGLFSPYMMTTLGNLAQFWQLRGEYAYGQSMLERELAMLDTWSIAAPAVRAKVYAGISFSMLNLAARPSDIAEAVEAAIRHAETATQGTEPANDMQIVAAQILQVLVALDRSPAFDNQEQVLAWRARVDELNPAADERVRGADELNRILADTSADLTDAIRRADQMLETELGSKAQVETLFSKAEAQAARHQFGESSAVFTQAAARSRELSLGLGPGWTSLINAWRDATLWLLTAQSLDGVERFCEDLSQIIGDDAPDAPDDRAALAVCRAATAVTLGTLDEAKPLVDALPATRHAASYLAGRIDLTSHLMDATRAACHIRVQLKPQAICLGKGWRRIQVDTNVNYLVRVDSTTLATLRSQAPGSVQARWVLSEPGIGLMLDGPVASLLWFFTSETGWVDMPGAPPFSATARLRQRLDQDFRAGMTPAVLITDHALESDLDDLYATGVAITVSREPLET